MFLPVSLTGCWIFALICVEDFKTKTDVCILYVLPKSFPSSEGLGNRAIIGKRLQIAVIVILD